MSVATHRASSGIWRFSQAKSRVCGGAARDDHETIPGETGDGEIGLDAAALVQPLGVDDPAWSDVDVIGRDAVEHRHGVAALEHEFGEGGLIEQADRILDGFSLARGIGEPVLAAIGIVDIPARRPAGRTSSGRSQPLTSPKQAPSALSRS